MVSFRTAEFKKSGEISQGFSRTASCSKIVLVIVITLRLFTFTT